MSSFCPYCKGAVSPDLVRAGGNCTHCMLEIPGEEAPTDPGLEARMRQVAEDARHAKRARTRARIFAGLAACTLAVAAGAGWWRMQQEAEALVYELDDVYMAPRDGMIAAVEKPATGPGVASIPSKVGIPTKRTPRGTPGTGDPPTGDPLHTVAEGGSRVGPASVKYVEGTPNDDIKVGLGAGGATVSPLGGVDIKIDRLGTGVLQTDEEILKMAKTVTGAYAPQVETCVQQKLKVDESFGGGWRVNFTIGTEGTVKGLKISALNAPDAELEACMQRAISSWRFERIAHEFKVAKNYRFSPSL